MKLTQSLLLAGAVATAHGEKTNPLSTVLNLMDELTAKIMKDGEAGAKAYDEYLSWCKETSANVGFTIKTAKSNKEKLEAKISELSSDIEVATSKIDDLASAISAAEGELKKATTVREKELATFATDEKELMEGIDTLTRATDVLSKEFSKNPAFAQVSLSGATTVLQSLSVVLDAAAFPSDDKKKLTALIQAQQSDADDDEQAGAPAAAAYKSKSGGIIDVLEDMREKAEGQLSDLRKAETKSKHNFEMLAQSLKAKVSADTKDMKDQKSGRSEDEEGKASAEGDLKKTVKELKIATKELETATSTCMQVAADHEATKAAQKEELEVIATAKKILVESSKGAAASASFLQITETTGLAGGNVVKMVRALAKQQHSSELAQLASRMVSVLRNRSRDPFAKVKGMIVDMISKLEKEAKEDATEKAYCDEQMAKTGAKQGELQDDIEKATSKIDTAASKTAKLKEEVRVLEGELSTLAKEQAEMDKIRGDENAAYVASKKDLETALTGVRKALQVLRDYYGGAAALVQDDAHFTAMVQQPAKPETFSKAAGAGGSIVNVLEVVESDLSTNLAKLEAEEAEEAEVYETVTQENAVAKTSMEQDLKYKTESIKSLATTLSEFKSDRDTANEELDAVNEYFAKIKDRCIAKPETYEDRVARRTAEIKGLKQALSILQDEAASFVQRKRHNRFRGSMSVE